MFGALKCRFRNLDTKEIGAEIFGELQNGVLKQNGKINKLQISKMVRKSNHWKVLESVCEKRTLLNNVLGRKANWTRWNFILHYSIEKQMNEVKERSSSMIWEKIWGAKVGSWRSKKMETTVYYMNLRNKYKLSFTNANIW